RHLERPVGDGRRRRGHSGNGQVRGNHRDRYRGGGVVRLVRLTLVVVAVGDDEQVLGPGAGVVGNRDAGAGVVVRPGGERGGGAGDKGGSDLQVCVGAERRVVGQVKDVIPVGGQCGRRTLIGDGPGDADRPTDNARRVGAGRRGHEVRPVEVDRHGRVG